MDHEPSPSIVSLLDETLIFTVSYRAVDLTELHAEGIDIDTPLCGLSGTKAHTSDFGFGVKA